MKKWLIRIGAVIIGIAILMCLWVMWNLKDRHSGYEIDLTLKTSDLPGSLKVGFAALPITPDIMILGTMLTMMQNTVKKMGIPITTIILMASSMHTG